MIVVTFTSDNVASVSFADIDRERLTKACEKSGVSGEAFIAQSIEAGEEAALTAEQPPESS